MTTLVRTGRALATLLLTCAAAAHAAAPPRVGLVLGGGGARGAAHIGVLEVLQQLHVPIACVAGTSMGALVAGAWAAGLSPAEMRSALASADWADMFDDSADYRDQTYRNKLLSQRYLPGSEAGVKAAGVFYPPGVISGQKIKLFFNRLVHEDRGEHRIQDLPLPVSIIATDIGNGERVVFRDGSLTQAMRASMSVPGLLAPLDWRGHKLVDGGLVDNLPVREVRERCHPDVVIAVDVGSPLLPRDQVNGLLGISTQVIQILTEQNVAQSRALLTANDLYIRPALDGISSLDFARAGETADLGRAAAEALAPRLQALAVPAAEYAAWDAHRVGPPRKAPPVDAIRIADLERVAPETIARYLQQRPGQPLDTAQLDRDLMRVYGDGDFENVDYALLDEHGRHVLRITPLEKSWGPDYLRFALNLNSSLSQGSTYSLRAAYQQTWLNPLGGEMLYSAEIGSNAGAGVEWYQPLDGAHRFFADSSLSYRRDRIGFFQDDHRVAEYILGTGRLQLSAGVNLGLAGQARLGWRASQRNISIETGVPVVPDQSVGDSGWIADLDLDRLNRLYFPSRGWSASVNWFESPQNRYARLGVDLRSAHSFGAYVLGTRFTYTGSPRGLLPPYDAASLGGFLNLSAFASGQLLADQARYAHLRVERIVGRAPLGLRGDLRLGVALEAGKVGRPFSETQRTGWLDSTTVYLGGQTPFGPVYVGVAYSTSGVSNAYLFLGTP